MADIQELQKKLKQKYALETDILHWELWQEQLEGRLPELKHGKREAETALLEYESGGIKSFFDKLTGRREERLEQLRRSKAHAENNLEAAQRELQDLARNLDRARAELESFREWEMEYAEVIRREDQLQEQLQRLEALLCAKALILTLEGNRKALENAREMASADVAVDYLKNMHYSEADAWAKKSRKHLERIAKCGILLEIHPYFDNPTGYIVGVAAEYGQLDRVNSALKVVRETDR